ncbi:uncharacterized protein DSM5745_03287 [Aspergillus mulundensis]|uniref:Uncharacterized protein n=1 Tax=Aspergillus mulundensis TaxID=1810919 RepID=A0A3D8SJY3_9EURO|nr:hypothetical protein DSM5745_03287 [Aspergillus mulundensis]RDW86645.1 hypothetical protein DSM5745_03287 [Aspergillus mulundensis]
MDPAVDSPSSLLWATQLRQENIQLNKKMNELNSFLTSAMATIDHLRQSIDLQAEHIEQLEKQQKLDKEQLITNIRESDAKIGALEAHSGRDSGEDNDERYEEIIEQVRKLEQANRELTATVTETSDKINALQAENGTLRVGIGETRQRLGALEKENAALKQEITRADENFGLSEQTNVPLNTKVMDVLQQFDQTRTENAELKVQIGEIAGKCDVLETEKAQLKQDLTGLAQTLERTQCENGDLTGRVRLLENGVSLLEKQAAKSQNWMSMKTLAADRDSRATSTKPRLVRTQTDQDGDQEMRIPDSMPTPASRHSTRDKALDRTTSETTWGSLTDLDASCTPKRGGVTASPSKKVLDVQETLASLIQDGRSLGAYLQYAVSLRKRPRFTIPDGTYIPAFMAGLKDEGLKKRLKEHTRRAGVSWSNVLSFMEAEIAKLGQDQKDEEQVDEDVMRTPVKRDSEGLGRGPFGFRKENRPRRSIPIVPVDEEDEQLMT